MNTDALIDALRAELAGYLRRGLPERAKAVEKELARLGFGSSVTADPVVQAGPGDTPAKPATRTRKPAEPTKKAPAPKTPETKKKPKK